MRKILLIIPLLFILTACNYKELNNLAVVSGISISKNNNKEYIIKVSVINPEKIDDGTNTNYIIYENKDTSLELAFRNIIKKSPYKLYGTHINILVLDEKICKDNLSEVIDFIARNPDIRNEFYILVSKSNDILETNTKIEELPTLNIYKSLINNRKYLGITKTYTFDNLLSDYLNNNKEITIPSIDVSNDNNIIISNLSIFKENKLIGYLSEEESLTYNFINNDIKETLIKLNYSNNTFITNQILGSNTKIRVYPKKNVVDIYINGDAIIKESSLDTNKNINKIEHDLNNHIEKLIENNIYNIINKYNSDIFGFLDMYYKKDPWYYKKINNNWYDNYYRNINIHVNSNIRITSTGNNNMEEYDD